MLTTQLCEFLGIEVPVLQAPIGSATTPELAAAVSNAGGFGMLAATWLDFATLAQRINATQRLTHRPFGINLVMAFPFEERVELALGLGVQVISTAWGDATAARSRIPRGVTHLHSVGSVDEALRAADAGVDAIIAQGWEAGGHVLGVTASMALVPAVVDAVSPLPVIAAGGIADGRGLAAALVLGAQGSLMGTRFLAAEESNTHDVYRQRVLAAAPDDAVYTTAFDGNWPGAPHRALRNATLSRWEIAGQPAAPNRPGEDDVIAVDSSGEQHRRYEDLIPLREMSGELGEMALYAGQSAGIVHKVAPAGEIVRAIVAEAEAALAIRGGAAYLADT